MTAIAININSQSASPLTKSACQMMMAMTIIIAGLCESGRRKVWHHIDRQAHWFPPAKQLASRMELGRRRQWLLVSIID